MQDIREYLNRSVVEKAMTSLEIADLIGKRHNNVMRDIEAESCKLGYSISKLIFEQTSYTDKSNRQSKMYNISREGVMQLSAKYDAVVRYKMIQRLNKLDNKASLLLDLFSNDVLTISKAHKELIELETQPLLVEIAESKPKLNYYDNVLNSNKLITATDIAKDLGMSAIELNKKLYDLKIQYKQNNIWHLYAKYETKVPEYADYKITEFGQSLRWTELGRRWIIELLN